MGIAAGIIIGTAVFMVLILITAPGWQHVHYITNPLVLTH